MVGRRDVVVYGGVGTRSRADYPRKAAQLVAPYDQPIDLYDDTLVAPGFVSRQPRWNLPNGEIRFLTSEGENLLNTPSCYSYRAPRSQYGLRNRAHLAEGGRRSVKRNARVQMVHNMHGHAHCADNTKQTFERSRVAVASGFMARVVRRP